MGEIRWLGVDVGWVFPAVDSDANIYQWTRWRRPEEWITRAGPVTVRRADGSTITRPPYSLAEAAQVFARGIRSDGPLGILATQVVNHAQRTGQGLALEDWQHFQRRKAAWVDVWRGLSTRALVRDIPVVQVNRAYTSITCPDCHRKDRANRASRDRFRCVGCGLTGQADVIAARNISAKAAGRFMIDEGRCSNPACSDGVIWAAGFCLFCYRFRRREGRCPTDAEFSERRRSEDSNHYRTLRRGRILREAERRRDAAAAERLAESYRTHDAWGNPIGTDA